MMVKIARSGSTVTVALLGVAAVAMSLGSAHAQTSSTPDALTAKAPAAATTVQAAVAPAGVARAKPIRKTEKAPSDAVNSVTTGSVAKPAASSKTSGRCTRLAFEVNDWGKDGPTNDAKALLDKHVATWAAGKGIKKYTIGKKTVNCRLFLDFGFADEHTCRAEAPVCW